MGLLYRDSVKPQGGTGANQHKEQTGNGFLSATGNETAAKIAKQFGVNERTVRNAAKFVDDLEAISKVDEELEAEILTSPSPPKRKAQSSGPHLCPWATVGLIPTVLAATVRNDELDARQPDGAQP